MTGPALPLPASSVAPAVAPATPRPEADRGATPAAAPSRTGSAGQVAATTISGTPGAPASDLRLQASRPVAAATRAPASPQAVAAPAAATSNHYWRPLFADWPSQIPKRGIVVSQQNETSPFKSFMLRGEFVLFERVSPDSLGGRFVVLPYAEIAAVKFTDPLKQAALEAAGFVGSLSH